MILSSTTPPTVLSAPPRPPAMDVPPTMTIDVYKRQEQFGFDPAARRRRNRLIQIAISLAVAAAAFALYAAAAAQRVPSGAIGQADAMTNIRVCLVYTSRCV